MTKLEALKALAEKVEAGAFDAVPGGAQSPMFNAFMDVAECAFGMYGPVALPRLSWDTYKGCLNSAKALMDAVLPGWDIQINTYEDDTFEASVSHPRKVKTYDGVSPCMARAWLLAILKALIAQEEAA